MSPRKLIEILLFTTVFGSYALSSTGQELNNGLPYSTDKSIIDGNALSNVHGRITVNMAAGDSNRQMNAGAFAIDQNGGLATALTTSHQAINSTNATPADFSTALINGNAFAGSTGAISINQTSGVLNSQANGLAFALGSEVEAVSESVLSDTHSGAGLIDSDATMGNATADIADTAFVGARGLIQINQSAGSRNTTANNFAFQLKLEANP
jgi:hypothetical protein